MRRLFSFVFILSVLLMAPCAQAGEPVDLDAVTKIRNEGFRNSQVMDFAWQLTEGVGPRLTGTPQSLEAHEWAKTTFEEWGLKSWLEDYDFGKSWMVERVQVRMVAPYVQPLEALSEAWAPGTDGPVRGRVVRATLESEEDFEEWSGKLEGAIILLEDAPKPEQVDAELFKRLDEERLEELEIYDVPGDRGWGKWRKRRLKRYEFWKKLAAFYEEEGVLATIEPSSRDNGVVRVSGSSSKRSEEVPVGIPALAMATEQYNRLIRMLDKDIEPELEIDVAVQWFDDDPKAYNTIADLPGSDLADQFVMVGGHLDSWHTGTGATDNGGNCAIVMEALRIIKDAGLQPRRTIRAALWSGEEQGYMGSRDYVESHLATRPETTDPEQLALPTWARERTWPIEPLPAHSSVSAYFNIDNGCGQIRGIYAEENAAIVPIFEAWFKPFADLGADTVTMEKTGGTDHQPFDWVGVPGFQFIQDPMDYMGRTHHTNVDTYDHLNPEDLKKTAVILASFLWHAANRDEMLPRKPMPEEPKKTEKPKPDSD
jgi:carboxypeptidase Q